VNYDKLASERKGELSSAVRERVTAARLRQAERFKHTRLLSNYNWRVLSVNLITTAHW
jgi:predicted ATPase with chaperone activity